MIFHNTLAKKPVSLQGFLVIFLMTLFVLLQIKTIFLESRIYDEPLFVEAGWRFLREKDFSFEPFNPPLTRELTALPLLFDQKIFSDPHFFWPRMTVVFFSLCLIILVYLWSKSLYGKWASLFSVVVLILTPEVLAYSHYANPDLMATFFAFSAFFCFDRYFLRQSKISGSQTIFFCFLAGLAFSARVSNVFFVLIPLFTYWAFFLRKKIKIRFNYLVMGILTILLTIWSTYFFTFEPVFGYRKDPNRQAIEFVKKYPQLTFLLKTPVPLGSYLSTIKNNFLYNQTDKFPKYVAFWGKFQQSGPGYLMWPIFLIKTPIPIIFVLIYGFLRKSQIRSESFLKFCLILIFLLAIPLGTTLRLRYFLILYPLIAVLAGGLFNDFKKNIRLTAILGVLIAWLILGTASVYPHFLTYFNEIIGGRKSGYKYVVDSNLDWGQGLPTLKKFLNSKNMGVLAGKEFQLAYFGSADPSVYGLPSHIRIKDFNALDKQPISDLDVKKPMVISASCWYFCGYYQDERLKKLKPEVLSGQFLLFNF